MSERNWWVIDGKPVTIAEVEAMKALRAWKVVEGLIETNYGHACSKRDNPETDPNTRTFYTGEARAWSLLRNIVSTLDAEIDKAEQVKQEGPKEWQ